jgi:glycosyltransferase involved in cell wall biosynthesis
MGCEPNKEINNLEHYVTLDHFVFPVFEGLIQKEGFRFVKVDDDKLNKIIQEQDVVHWFLPFKLAKHAKLIADVYNIPVTGAYHLQPDSISSAIHMNYKFLNWCIYRGFYHYIYKMSDFIHCPSQMIADKATEYGCRNEFRTISNGITDFWHKVPSTKKEEDKDKIVITMVGRLAREKRQDLLIKAIKKSKYEDKIQLVLCGQGPDKKKYEKLIDKLNFTNKPRIQFCSQEELRYFLSSADIYVHCSDAETEGLGCVEAFACGLVPIISDSKVSATKQFALCKESLFKKGSSSSLAKKIDYWIEHPEEKKAYSQKYIELSKEYALPLQVEKFEKFFEDAIKQKEDKLDKYSIKVTSSERRKQKKIFKKLLKQGKIKELPEVLK